MFSGTSHSWPHYFFFYSEIENMLITNEIQVNVSINSIFSVFLHECHIVDPNTRV